MRTTYSARGSTSTNVTLKSPYNSASSGQYLKHLTCLPGEITTHQQMHSLQLTQTEKVPNRKGQCEIYSNYNKVQHKIPESLWRLKWSLCWMNRTPRRRSSFVHVCANNSRDKTSIHVFPRNDETVKHFLVALSAELMLSTLTGMFSVFHGQFSPAYCLSQRLTLPTSTRLVTMTMQADCSCHTILQKSYTVSCTGPAHSRYFAWLQQNWEEILPVCQQVVQSFLPWVAM